MVARLKKAKKPTGLGTGNQKAPKPRVFALQTGSPRQLKDPIFYTTCEAAKTAGMEFFREWTEWSKRHNSAGLTAIDQAVKLVEAIPEIDWIGEPFSDVHCLLDDYTGLTLAVRLWKRREQ